MYRLPWVTTIQLLVCRQGTYAFHWQCGLQIARSENSWKIGFVPALEVDHETAKWTNPSDGSFDN
jgi:hypothetical protein